ncbi:nuclear transport factor 2 family protein [Novosphingobium huizhouense]|uniref:nuclear transport factor 2 family protein n=1 Tax=Novosphingobium huizhouense TaxID=2866625 RepID=UPI001CD8D766|nr:nuclear transport factor 2 family protein [Novosphingobium huizhouense]
MTEIDPVARLIAIEEIKQLKARYFRLMDTKDYAGLRTVFADDAVFDAACSLSIEPAEDTENWIHQGGDNIAAFVEAAVDPLRTVHHGHCHEIEVLSATEARGVIAMEDKIWDAQGKLFLHGMGHYHETYRKDGGAWRIVTSRITRLHVILGE